MRPGDGVYQRLPKFAHSRDGVWAGRALDKRRADDDAVRNLGHTLGLLWRGNAKTDRQRAANELEQIEAVSTQHAKRWAVVPLMAEEPVGVELLRQLARH